MMLRAGSVEDVQAAVRGHRRLRVVGRGSKPALSADAREGTASGALSAAAPALLDVSALTGVLDYSAQECVFSARAGTMVAEVEEMLARDGLYLPFEPPFRDRGATLGGTVAAGLSGPGRLRYGGVRDFLLGVRFVDGEGRVAHGGGRVVKNAAGFSLQHLLLGSLGRLGVLVELTFKVFPRPPARVTVAAEFASFERALDALVRLRRSTFEPDAAELLPASAFASASASASAPGSGSASASGSALASNAAGAATLFVRMAGIESALDARVSELTSWLDADRTTRLAPADADAFWHTARECSWCDVGPQNAVEADSAIGAPEASNASAARGPADAASAPVTMAAARAASTHAASTAAAAAAPRGGVSLVKVPVTPGRVMQLAARLDACGGPAASHAAAASRAAGSAQAAAAAQAAGPGLVGLAAAPAPVWRFGAGGEVAWIAWPGPLGALHGMLTDLGLHGLVLTVGRDTANCQGANRQGANRQGANSQSANSDSANSDSANSVHSGHGADAGSTARAGGGSAGSIDTPGSEGLSSPLIGAPQEAAFLARVRKALDPRGVFA